MKRRDFITVLGAAVAWPLAARAQQAAMPVVGFISSFTDNPEFAGAFRRGLSEVGYNEGRNIAIEYHWAGGGYYDRLPKVVADLVARQVGMIVASPIPAALAAKAVTTTIPIVFAVGSDPIASGLVTSLNRPGGNLTGVGFRSVALGAKRLELLRELLPKITSVALLVNPNNANAEPQTKDMKEAAAKLGAELVVWRASSEDGFDSAFITQRQRVDALVVSADPFFISHRDRLVMLAARHSIPAIYYGRDFAVAGGLMSYGTNFSDAFRHAGIYVGRILMGEKPSDLPIILSDKFEFVFNLKTARVLGLKVPLTLQVAADEVIE